MATPPFTLKNFTAASRKRNMHDFGLMGASQDLAWIADNAVGFTVPTLAAGATGVYTMLDGNGRPIASGLGARVYVNGVRQYGGLAYTLNGSTLTFLAPYIPQSDDKILVELEGIGSPIPGASFAAGFGPIQGQYPIPVIGGHATPDLSIGKIQYLTLTSAGVILDAPANVPGPVTWQLVVTQDATGNWPWSFAVGAYLYMVDPSTLNLAFGVQYTWILTSQLGGTVIGGIASGPNFTL